MIDGRRRPHPKATGQDVRADELPVYLMGYRKAGLGSRPPLSIEHSKRPAIGPMLLW